MSFKEVKELRQAGKLDKALSLAQETLAADPDNIWNQRSIAWVHYEYLKKSAAPEGFDLFIEHLVAIANLNLPEDEEMLFDNCAWQIGKMVFGLVKANVVDHEKINLIYNAIRSFHFTKPSEGYSYILKAFQKGHKEWHNYADFIQWWNLQNLRKEDFTKEEYQGKRIMSIAEQAFIAYSKSLLRGYNVIDNGIHVSKYDIAAIQAFLPLLKDTIQNHPNFTFLQYYHAKLLIISDKKSDAFETLLSFAKTKQNEFWVWQLLAELLVDKEEDAFACLCKALSLHAKDEYVIKLRQRITPHFIQRKLYAEAKNEIDRIVEARISNGWKIPKQIEVWQNEDWYKKATSNANNDALYEKYAPFAEAILYSDVSPVQVVVTFVNHKKGILNFVQNKDFSGFFKYKDHTESPNIGDVFEVRLKAIGNDGLFKVLTIEEGNADDSLDVLKTYSGNISIPAQKDFGFVDSIFVSPNLIENKVNDRDLVEGRAIFNFNKHKGEWGWKAITCEKASNPDSKL